MSLIGSNKLTTEPSTLYGKIFAQKSTVQRNQYGQQTTITTNIIDEYADNETAQKTISTFCCEIYRITGNHTDTIEQLKILYQYNKELINAKLVLLLKQGFSLSAMFDIILSDNDYSDDNIILTEHCLTVRKQDKTRLIDTTALKNKIVTLVANTSNEQVTGLIIRVNKIDPEIKAMVVDEIVRKDNSFINSLPSQLLDLAVEAFTKETSTAYITNYPYLEIVAEKCSASQKSVLINALLQNFQANRDIDKTLGVFEKMTIGNQKERALVHAQLDNYLETIPKENDTSKKRVEALMEKLNKKSGSK